MKTRNLITIVACLMLALPDSVYAGAATQKRRRPQTRAAKRLPLKAVNPVRLLASLKSAPNAQTQAHTQHAHSMKPSESQSQSLVQTAATRKPATRPTATRVAAKRNLPPAKRAQNLPAQQYVSPPQQPTSVLGHLDRLFKQQGQTTPSMQLRDLPNSQVYRVQRPQPPQQTTVRRQQNARTTPGKSTSSKKVVRRTRPTRPSQATGSSITNRRPTPQRKPAQPQRKLVDRGFANQLFGGSSRFNSAIRGNTHQAMPSTSAPRQMIPQMQAQTSAYGLPTPQVVRIPRVVGSTRQMIQQPPRQVFERQPSATTQPIAKPVSQPKAAPTPANKVESAPTTPRVARAVPNAFPKAMTATPVAPQQLWPVRQTEELPPPSDDIVASASQPDEQTLISAATRAYDPPVLTANSKQQVPARMASRPVVKDEPGPNMWQRTSQAVPSGRKSDLKKLQSRKGMIGLRGFCPVAMQERLALVDSLPQFESVFENHIYYFSSKDAKDKFDANPTRYSPAAGGRDVVAMNRGVETAGNLDHAVWYRGRLYMFVNEATRTAFKANPQAYAGR